jgi:serine/threonine-protein kinase
MSSTPPPELPVQTGDVIAGKYRVERVIGAGGMGAVVEATHLALEQRVAIKFMLERDAEKDRGLQRFEREARAANKLRSEHVPRMIDFGTLDGGTPYLVMELLEGRDLARMIQSSGALPIDEACEIGVQVCEALAEAHSRGIIHRDIKPANLFVTRRADGSPSVKVLDFGIAKHLDPAGIDPQSLTRSNAMLGSPLYMPIEQFRSAREVDARSDIWSLGIVLYQALTGELPFVADNMGALIMVLLSEEPRPPSALRRDIPPALSDAVLRCLGRKPADRFQNVAELAEALSSFAPPRCLPLLDRIHAHLHGEAGARASSPDAGDRPSRSGAKGAISSTGGGASTPLGKTGAAWTQTGAGPRPGGKGRLLLAAAFVLPVGLAAAVFLGRDRGAPPGVTALPPPPVATTVPAVVPVVPVDSPSAIPSPAATTSAVPSSTAAVAPPAPVEAKKSVSAPRPGPETTSRPKNLPDYGGRK